MARYDYKCSSCGNVFEVEHPMSETPEVVCPNCGAPAAKTFSASGIKFEGSGFYLPNCPYFTAIHKETWPDN